MQPQTFTHASFVRHDGSWEPRRRSESWVQPGEDAKAEVDDDGRFVITGDLEHPPEIVLGAKGQRIFVLRLVSYALPFTPEAAPSLLSRHRVIVFDKGFGSILRNLSRGDRLLVQGTLPLKKVPTASLAGPSTSPPLFEFVAISVRILRQAKEQLTASAERREFRQAIFCATRGHRQKRTRTSADPS